MEKQRHRVHGEKSKRNRTRRTERKARGRGVREKQEEDRVKKGDASNVGCRALFLSLI